MMLATQNPAHMVLSSSHLLSLALLLPIPVRKPQTHTIDTMPLISRRRVSLPLENMPQMSPTIAAHDLRPRHPEGAVRMPRHRPRDTVEIRRPATPAFELVRSFVERRIARGAGVHARGGHVLIVFAREGRLGAFLAEDAELFFVQNSLPLIIALLHRVRHVSGSGAAE